MRADDIMLFFFVCGGGGVGGVVGNFNPELHCMKCNINKIGNC